MNDNTFRWRDVLHDVLVAHQRRTASHCLCEWSELGASHAQHVVDEFEKAMTPVDVAGRVH